MAQRNSAPAVSFGRRNTHLSVAVSMASICLSCWSVSRAAAPASNQAVQANPDATQPAAPPGAHNSAASARRNSPFDRPDADTDRFIA